jgi:superoxide reductase
MLVEHHIVWIEISFNDVVIRKFMKPGDSAEAEFCGVPDDVKVTARVYCNLHGLWSSCETCEN